VRVCPRFEAAVEVVDQGKGDAGRGRMGEKIAGYGEKRQESRRIVTSPGPTEKAALIGRVASMDRGAAIRFGVDSANLIICSRE
jgi:hypothetical protein